MNKKYINYESHEELSDLDFSNKTILYEVGQYVLFHTKRDYVVYNKNKSFKSGHAHLNNKNAAIKIMDLAYQKKVPFNLDIYRLKSILRITDDEKYLNRVESVLAKRIETKKKLYLNPHKKNIASI